MSTADDTGTGWSVFDAAGQPYTQGGAVIVEASQSDAELMLALLPEAHVGSAPVGTEPTTSWVANWYARHRAWLDGQ